MATGRDIVTRSLLQLGVLGEGETASGQQLADGISIANTMLDSWGVDKSMIYTVQEENFPLVAGTQNYTIGSGATFNTVRPIEILQAWVRDQNSQDYPLEIWDEGRWSQILQKSLQGVPRVLRYLPSFANGSIGLFEVPGAGMTFTLYIVTRKQFTALTADATVSLPPGYERALITNLAVEEAPYYDKTPGDVLTDLAITSKEVIRRANLPEVVASYDAELSQRRRSAFNINRGY